MDEQISSASLSVSASLCSASGSFCSLIPASTGDSRDGLSVLLDGLSCDPSLLSPLSGQGLSSSTTGLAFSMSSDGSSLPKEPLFSSEASGSCA